MVQMMRSDDFLSGTAKSSSTGESPVKREIEETLEEANGTVNKRPKCSSRFNQLGTESNEFPIPPSQYNPLDEPSPLGLRLRKSPSLLDLIQMRLSQGNASSFGAGSSRNLNMIENKDVKGNSGLSVTDKLKASNFPASLLRIGHWEYVSRYEGDLVAKCYFAKHKLVWEILDGGLKSKIEIQWSDITALKANCPDNGPGTLILVLARQPLFFRETNPQPRKHTLWQATADFTDGEASLNRQHFLQCPEGLLDKHYEKLIQCDMRLNLLSRQPELILDSPYFEARGSVFEDPDESKNHDFNQPEIPRGSPISSFKTEQQDFLGRVSEHLSQAPSPSSVMDLRAIEGNGGSNEGGGLKLLRNLEQLKVPGIRPSMSMSDIVNHIEHCISEQVASGNQSSEKAVERKDMLENIAQILLGDTQLPPASDEKFLMARVNSLCCLLQDPSNVSNERGDGNDVQVNHGSNSKHGEAQEEGDSKDVFGSKQALTMSRKDSYLDLLSNLPRIASLPGMLFDISEDQPFG